MKSKSISPDLISKLEFLMWDYDIRIQDVYGVLRGHKERAGHYTEITLFKKLLESFPWFAVLEIIPLPRIKYLLDNFDLSMLRHPQLQKRYEFIREKISSLV